MPDMSRRKFLENAAMLGTAVVAGSAGLWLAKEHVASSPEQAEEADATGSILRERAEARERVPEENPFAAIFDYATEKSPEITQETIAQAILWWKAQYAGEDESRHTDLMQALERMKTYDTQMKRIFFEEDCISSLRYIALPESS